jgi:hypothetical protein
MKKPVLFECLSAVLATTLIGLTCGPGPVATKAPISITAPAAANKFVAGDTIAVTWTQSVTNPKLSYTYNFGGGWQSFATVIPVNAQQVNVVLPTSNYSDSFQIQVEDNSAAFDPGKTGYFAVKYIVITSPVGGASLAIGQTFPITWKLLPEKFTSLKFELSTDSGKTWNEMFGQSISNFTPPKNWVIGSEPGWDFFPPPSTGCMLKISEYNSAGINDKTGTFSVN